MCGILGGMVGGDDTNGSVDVVCWSGKEEDDFCCVCGDDDDDDGCCSPSARAKEMLSSRPWRARKTNFRSLRMGSNCNKARSRLKSWSDCCCGCGGCRALWRNLGVDVALRNRGRIIIHNDDDDEAPAPAGGCCCCSNHWTKEGAVVVGLVGVAEACVVPQSWLASQLVVVNKVRRRFWNGRNHDDIDDETRSLWGRAIGTPVVLFVGPECPMFSCSFGSCSCSQSLGCLVVECLG